MYEVMSPVLVKFERRDDDIARVDADGSSGAIGLVSLNPVDMDNPLLAVHLRDLAFPPRKLAPHNPHLVILANRDRSALHQRIHKSESGIKEYKAKPQTLYFPRSSFESAEDMILRRTDEGASKWSLRLLRREDAKSGE